MRIIYTKKFKKNFKKLRSSEIKRFEERVKLFIQNTSNSILNNPTLHGKLSNYRSFRITGDLRVLYQQIDEHTMLFVDMDTHSNLYS